MAAYTLWALVVTSRSVLTAQFLMGDCPVVIEEPCDTNMVKFTLLTATGQYQLNPFKPVLPKEFNTLSQLKILIHGYGGLDIDTATTNVSKAYYNMGYNVIMVNWGLLAPLPCYVTAFLNTWHVAQCIAILVVSLIPLGITPYFIHLVGFSLGAHIAGFTGKNLKNALGYSVHRITGLDPALPFFATINDEWKLNSNDANFVDVIHTSAGFYGKIEALGDIDFYVNGGTLQPSCKDVKNPLLCNHIMAGIYFAKSISDQKSYVGMKCDSLFKYILGLCEQNDTAIMGEYTDFKSRGTYFVDTSEKANVQVIVYI